MNPLRKELERRARSTAFAEFNGSLSPDEYRELTFFYGDIRKFWESALGLSKAARQSKTFDNNADLDPDEARSYGPHQARNRKARGEKD